MSNFSYFYNDQAEKFAFYRIPQMLFTDERFTSLSTEAKFLYGLMLDRISLSRRNGMTDKLNRVYIYFTLDEVIRHFDSTVYLCNIRKFFMGYSPYAAISFNYII